MRSVLGVVAGLLVLSLSADAADVTDLIKKIKDADPSVRRQAAKELAEAGPDAKPAVAVLIAGLRDSDLFVRRFSAQALGSIGPDAAAAVKELQYVLRNPRESKEVQEAAAAALGKLGKGGVEALLATVRDTNKEPEVRRKAVESLGEMGPDARGAVSALVEALRGGGGNNKKKAPPNTGDIRVEVATALGQIASAKDAEAIKALEMIAGEKKNKNKTLKSAVNDALRKIKARQ